MLKDIIIHSSRQWRGSWFLKRFHLIYQAFPPAGTRITRLRSLWKESWNTTLHLLWCYATLISSVKQEPNNLLPAGRDKQTSKHQHENREELYSSWFTSDSMLKHPPLACGAVAELLAPQLNWELSPEQQLQEPLSASLFPQECVVLIPCEVGGGWAAALWVWGRSSERHPAPRLHYQSCFSVSSEVEAHALLLPPEEEELQTMRKSRSIVVSVNVLHARC